MNTFHSEGRQLLFEAKHAHLDALSHVILLLRGTGCWRCPLWVQATNCFPPSSALGSRLLAPKSVWRILGKYAGTLVVNFIDSGC